MKFAKFSLLNKPMHFGIVNENQVDLFRITRYDRSICTVVRLCLKIILISTCTVAFSLKQN